MVRVGTSREANRKSTITGMSSEDDRAVVAVSPQFSGQISKVVFKLIDVFIVHSMAARLTATAEIRPNDSRRTEHAYNLVATGARPAAGKDNDLVMSGSASGQAPLPRMKATLHRRRWRDSRLRSW